MKALRAIVRALGFALILAPALGGPATSALAQETDLVTQGSSCQVLANPADPGVGMTWTSETFDDSAWATGAYGVGYETGTGAAALLQTTVNTGSYSVFTRARFDVGLAASVTSLVLGCDHDDGFVAWINGVEVYRSPSMPAGALAWNTRAALHESSNSSAPQHVPFRDISAAALPALHDGVNVLAIGVWNSTMPSSDLVLCPRLVMNRPLAVERGPYLQVGTPTSVVIRWRTTLMSVGRVRVGPAPGALSAVFDESAASTEHEVAVSGLMPGTRACYSVGTPAQALEGDDSATCFVTPPLAGTRQRVRAWVIGDSGTGTAAAASVRDAFVAVNGSPRPDLWLMLGDNAYQAGSDEDHERGIFDMYPDELRSSVVWPTLGNHDGMSADSATQTGPYYDNFTLPAAGEAGGIASGTEAYWSFDWANIHFICLNSEGVSRLATGAMATWLAQDLAATRQDWVIAYWHHPAYTKGSHDSDVEVNHVEMRQNILPILEAAGVDLVLGGHSHSYERSLLVDGHHGVSSTLTAANILDGGDGRETGDGAYFKPQSAPLPRSGEVHVVAGCSGKVDTGPLDHPVMLVSMSQLGSVLLDVDGLRLDASFIDDLGAERDHFTILKDCAASDPGTRTPPPEVTSLVVTKPAPGSTDAALAWPDPAPAGGASALSDVATGLVSELRADRGFARAACLASGAPAAIVDARLPGSGDAHWYVVRARNACGTGPWGAAVGEPCP